MIAFLQVMDRRKNIKKLKSATSLGKQKRSATKYVKYKKALQDDLMAHRDGTGCEGCAAPIGGENCK